MREIYNGLKIHILEFRSCKRSIFNSVLLTIRVTIFTLLFPRLSDDTLSLLTRDSLSAFPVTMIRAQDSRSSGRNRDKYGASFRCFSSRRDSFGICRKCDGERNFRKRRRARRFTRYFLQRSSREISNEILLRHARDTLLSDLSDNNSRARLTFNGSKGRKQRLNYESHTY